MASTSNVSNGNVYNTTVNDGDILEIDNDDNLNGIATINNGGSSLIWYGSGTSFNLTTNDDAQLVNIDLKSPESLTTVINISTIIDDFSRRLLGNSNAIVLQDVNQNDVHNASYQNVSGNVKVEDLRVGNKPVTHDWKNAKEVIQNVQCAGYINVVINSNLSDDKAGYLLRILKDAIAKNIPYKDLLITSEHRLFFDDKFVPARMLVNDYNIFYNHSNIKYTYYHIEIDKHSVIYTDGMLTESYFNTGNRRTLNDPESNVVLFSQQNVGKNWSKDSCASQVTDCNFVEPLFNQIINRAQTLGLKKRMNALVLDKDPQLRIQTESGKIIYSHAQNKDRFLFAVPSDIENLHLISNISRPSDTIGGLCVDDKRSLGVLIGNITLLSQNNMKAIDAHLSQTNLKGWHGIESNLYRWTDGNAYLPLGTEYNNADEPRVNILVVHVVAGGPYVSLDEELKLIA